MHSAPLATAPAASAITIVGLLAVVVWLAWRFGPTLMRLAGWCSWCVAWACGSQGGYGYCLAFLVLGTLAWSGGTVWCAKRRGRWPSAISERLLTRALGRRLSLAPGGPPNGGSVVPLRRP
jgi:hypothetical protein